MTSIAAEPVIVLQPEGIEIPAGITSLERFRRWARSDAFPERGRIDWVAGRLEVDMSPEDVFTHGTPKSAVAGKLIALLQEPEKGLVFIDKTRVSSPIADLSAEPDVLLILDETLASGRVKLVPKASGEEGRYVEVEGSPDLVVECVSDSSVKKDTKVLRELYHAAGAREYWIVDARGKKLSFKVLHFRKDGYVEARRDSAGCLLSEVLGHRVRLVRSPKRSGAVYFRLEVVGA
ncbi:MAG: Uma2 family endonuclease [Planctomycetes bacterium]|nr:Uma2 family endonuclease [Planctomycetota bacterium]